jgi:hypothetical protein
LPEDPAMVLCPAATEFDFGSIVSRNLAFQVSVDAMQWLQRREPEEKLFEISWAAEVLMRNFINLLFFIYYKNLLLV